MEAFIERTYVHAVVGVDFKHRRLSVWLPKDRPERAAGVGDEGIRIVLVSFQGRTSLGRSHGGQVDDEERDRTSDLAGMTKQLPSMRTQTLDEQRSVLEPRKQ